MGQTFSNPSFDPHRDIPDLQDRVVVITGADSGIGFETADQLAAHGAKVYLVCITEDKALSAIERIMNKRPHLRNTTLLAPLQIDLSSVPSVQRAAQAILSRETRLDILVNNAGRLASDYVLNDAGIEMTVAVNHVGPFMFTKMLLPLLKATAALPGSDVRIISLSSVAHEWAPPNDFSAPASLNNTYAEKGAVNDWGAKFRRYGATKLMIILFIQELQRRLDQDDATITCLAVHPGEVSTAGAKTHIPFYILPYVWLFTLTPLQGAFTSLFASTSPEVLAERQKFKGSYLAPYGKIIEPKIDGAQSIELAAELWETTERLVKTILDGVSV